MFVDTNPSEYYWLLQLTDYETHMIQCDLETAFLYGELEKYLRITQPERFVKKGEHNKYVCLFKKSIYWLKLVPRV